MQLFRELHRQASQKFKASGDDVPIGDWLREHTTLNRKPFSFKRYPFQERIANDMHPNTTVLKCSQVGLAVSLETPIPTPYGWTTMGEVQVGDQVFDERGRVVEVTYKSPVWENRSCYEITFDSGTKIVTDGSHRWKVKSNKNFVIENGLMTKLVRRGNCSSLNFDSEGVITSEAIAESIDEANFYLPISKPLDMPEVNLPLDPYYLGVLLGDGCLSQGRITQGKEDAKQIISEFVRRGLVVNVIAEYDNYLVFSTTASAGKTHLGKIRRELQLTGTDKFVPEQFLWASENQRRDLLQGLMDTDGSIDHNGSCEFTNTNPDLIEAVRMLAASIGLKPKISWREPRVNNFGTKPCGRVRFTAYSDNPVFKLVRKLNKQPKRTSINLRTTHHRVVAIKKVQSVPTQCLTVDSPSHLFLISKSMIPTHNTEIQTRKMAAFLRRMGGTSGIFTLPTEDMYRRVYTTRISPLLKNDDVFNPPMVDKPVRRQDLVQIGDSWLYLTGCNEGPATSIPADILFHDELDLSDEAMIGLFQSRLQNSDYKITQAFSTPTYMGYGVDKNFALTDQFHYLIRCDSCNHHQFPLFEQDWIALPDLKFEVDKLTDMTPEQIAGLNLKQAYVKCCKCGSRLDLANADLREWVAKHPSRDNFRGYKVNPFSTDRISLEYIFTQLSKYKLNENEKGFHNTVLGEPYSPASAQIPEECIKACLAPHGRPEHVSQDRAVFMGVDMGAICHISLVGEHIDGKDPWFLFKTCHASQLQQTIAELRKEYNIVQGCADRYPYTPEVDSIRENTHGMLMPVAYEGKAILAPKSDEVGNLIYYTANRTFALDMVRTSIVNEVAVLGGYTSHKDTLVAHLRDMVREETPEKEPRWVKLNGNDHFFHSMALALVSRRVAEHMFLHNLEDTAMTLSILGLDMGKRNDPTDKFRSKGVNKYGFVG